MNHGVQLKRKTAYDMQEIVRMYIRAMKLSSGLNRQCIFRAWEDASGAGNYTLKKFYRDGKLYITVSSSVIRNQLYFQKDVLVEKMNEMLSGNELFTSDGNCTAYIKELILK